MQVCAGGPNDGANVTAIPVEVTAGVASIAPVTANIGNVPGGSFAAAAMFEGGMTPVTANIGNSPAGPFAATVSGGGPPLTAVVEGGAQPVPVGRGLSSALQLPFSITVQFTLNLGLFQWSFLKLTASGNAGLH